MPSKAFERDCRHWKKSDFVETSLCNCLYKNKGDKHMETNYRLVSLTVLPCRLCEKIVREIIMKHIMNDNDLFSNAQYGFRNKRSCVLQLLDVLNDWVKAYAINLQVVTVYLDIKKAFDSIPHKRLLLKLKSYGIEGKILDWIKDFLNERKQRDVLNGQASA